MANLIVVLDSTPKKYEVNIVRTNTWDDDFEIVDQSNSPVNLSGSTIECSIKSSPTGPAEATAATGNGILITGANSNVINIFKDIDITAGRYFWDIRVTFPSGKKATYVGGVMNVIQNITP